MFILLFLKIHISNEAKLYRIQTFIKLLIVLPILTKLIKD